MTARAWARVAVALASVSPFPACVPGGELALDHLKWQYNEQLRPDLGPSEEVSVGPYLSDGGDDGSQIVSPLFFPDIPVSQLRALRKSDCFWTGNTAGPKLFTEVILSEIQSPDLTFEPNRMGLCNLSHPETRERVRVDGFRELIFGGFDPEDAKPGLLRYETPRFTDSHNRCLAFDAAVFAGDAHASLASYIADAAGAADPVKLDCTASGRSPEYCDDRRATPLATFPCAHAYAESSCMLGCLLPAPEVDTVYALEALGPTDYNLKLFTPGVENLPQVLAHVKVVDTLRGQARPLARPLAFRGETTLAGGNRQSRWSWQVEESMEGRWAENFSPLLKVSRLRFFVEHGSDKTYLEETAFPAFVLLDNGSQPSQCAAPEGQTEVDLEACDPNLLVTPTYRHSDVAAKLTWTVDWVVAGGATFPVAAGDKVYIEFEVTGASVSSSGQGLTVSPPGLGLGRVRRNTPTQFKDVLRVNNFGSASVTVQRIWFEDGKGVPLTSGEFAPQTSSAHTPPFVLGPFASFPITVDTQPSQLGPASASLVIEASASGQLFRRLRAGVSALAVDASWFVAPKSLVLRRSAQPQQPPAEYERNVLVSNDGYYDVQRGSLRVDGPGAASYQVVGSDCAGAWGSPAPATCTLPSGGSELITVRFVPQSAGQHTAELRIGSDLGEAAAALNGWCSEEWYDAGGTLFQNPCRY